MKAIVFDKGLHFRTDYPVPTASHNEALIRVTYAGSGICPFCFRGLKNHCPDRSVLGILNKDGAFAEYLVLPINNLHIIPDSVEDIEAVFVEPLASAFEILEQVDIKPSHKVCVLGDGKLGLLIAQVLRLTECNLTVIGRHKEKLSILNGMGIETAILTNNPLSPPFNKKGEWRGFDIVVDATGSASGLETALKFVKPRGRIILKTTVARRGPVDLNAVVIDEVSIIGSRCGPFPSAIDAIKKRLVDVRPLVSKIFPIEDGIESLRFASQKGVLKVLLKIC